MTQDQFLVGERKAYEALYVATLRAIMAENDYKAAFKARQQFLAEQRFNAGESFDSERGYLDSNRFKVE